MAHLLHVDSSVFGESSVSKAVARSFRESWEAEHVGGKITHRDLGAEPVAQLTADAVSAPFTPEEARTAEQNAAFGARQALIQEVLDADAFLFSVPMYNWSVASTFKVWLDQVVLVGVTLSPTEDKPLAGRPATVVLSYGGGYSPGTPREGWDHVRPYLQTVLADALGLDVTFVTAQLTLAESNPAMAELIPLAKDSLAQAHDEARTHAKTVAARFDAAAAAA